MIQLINNTNNNCKTEVFDSPPSDNACDHVFQHDQGESIGLTWIISTAVVSVLLSLLGAYGAYKENIVILRVVNT